MASFEQAKYCPNCKKNVSATKDDRCKICGNKVERGTWSVRFRIIEYDSEKQKRLSGFKTKKEAQTGYIDFINQFKASHREEKENAKLTFEMLFDEYKIFAKNKLKESSYYDFCSKFNLLILPYFKNIKVVDITPKMLLNWQNWLNEKRYKKNGVEQPYSYKYKNNLRSYLNSMLSYAQRYYKIPNQLNSVDGFKNQNIVNEMQVWSPEEFFKFIDCVDNETYKCFFYALYFTGARKGEILATTWADWDLNNCTLNITKSVTKKVYDAQFLVTTPKNKSSVRKIKIPKILCDIFNEYKNGRESYKFVFAGDKPLADTNIQRALKNGCAKSQVKQIRIHDFRHSHASYLLSSGVPVVSVAKRLGHSNIEQTLNTYAHCMPTDEDILVNTLQRLNMRRA